MTQPENPIILEQRQKIESRTTQRNIFMMTTVALLIGLVLHALDMCAR